MRLNGKAAIMRYLGYNDKNTRSWINIKLRYGRVIYIPSHRGGHKHRFWTLAEWLNAVDLEQSKCVYDVEYDKLVQAIADLERPWLEHQAAMQRTMELVTG